MSYMRMRLQTAQGDEQPTQVQARRPGYRYNFTHNKWQAMAYLSSHMIMEGEEVDYQECFPARASSDMRYGAQYGIEIVAVEYHLVDVVNSSKGVRVQGRAVGVMATVMSAGRVLGYYAVQY
jgi:hypothetical protein